MDKAQGWYVETYVQSSLFDCASDYIPGLGDTASFVIVGASHDADRGRELGVGCNVLTTFYVGLLQNEREISQDVSYIVPQF